MYPLEKSEAGISEGKLVSSWLVLYILLIQHSKNPLDREVLFMIFRYMALERGGLNFWFSSLWVIFDQLLSLEDMPLCWAI